MAGHFEVPRGGRQVALLGDAELDEGAIWETLVDPVVSSLGEVLWIVDLNRQSLDRVVPDIAAGRIAAHVRGRRVADDHASSTAAGCASCSSATAARRCAVASTRCPTRSTSGCCAPTPPSCASACRTARISRGWCDQLDDDELLRAIRDLGGHDLGDLLDAFRAADAVTDRPSVIFAFTIKAWRLATQGHPANHSALLSVPQWRELAAATGADPDDPWARFPDGSPEAELCRRSAERLDREPVEPRTAPLPPADVGRTHAGRASTQQAFGRFFVDLSHGAPEVAAHVVTVSPDVASSTNLGGWINRVGIWSPGERIDWFADDTDTLVRWRETEHGQHIELGIAEGNLVGLLGELGATWSRDRQALLPIGTLYDPFVNRALEPWSFGIYAGGQSILVGTPSGVTLAPEGGAHQSIITPSVGLEQPRCIAWEPAFGQDLEWTLLYALSRLGRPDGTSSYFRLTTRPIDQALAAVPDDPDAREAPAPSRAGRRIPAAHRAHRAEDHARRGRGDHARGRRGSGGARGRRRGLRRRLPHLARSRLPRAAGPAGPRGGRRRDPRRAAARRSRRADRQRPRRASAHAQLPGRGARLPDRVPRASTTSASPATSTTCTATSGSTPTRSPAPPPTSWTPADFARRRHGRGSSAASSLGRRPSPARSSSRSKVASAAPRRRAPRHRRRRRARARVAPRMRSVSAPEEYPR